MRCFVPIVGVVFDRDFFARLGSGHDVFHELIESELYRCQPGHMLIDGSALVLHMGRQSDNGNEYQRDESQGDDYFQGRKSGSSFRFVILV